jgi:hypothetical protein
MDESEEAAVSSVNRSKSKSLGDAETQTGACAMALTEAMRLRSPTSGADASISKLANTAE